MSLALLLLACSGDEPDDTAPVVDQLDVQLLEPAFDTCRAPCLEVAATHDGTVTVESDIDGFLDVDTDLVDGEALVCLPRGLSPGAHTLAVHLDGFEPALVDAEVHPFGTAYGLDQPIEPLAGVPWIPEVTGLTDEPVLSWTADAWDSVSAMMPSSVQLGDQRFLYYAGTADVDFQLGVAELVDGVYVKSELNPILSSDGRAEGSWAEVAQNTPEALMVGDEVWLYYNGRGGAEGTTLSIGLATSTDGLHFTDHPDNPVFEPTYDLSEFDGRDIAHPSVLVRDGVFHLFYASGELQIGMALSDDGITWERHCGGPVFTGRPDSWDKGKVKAPEVVYADGLYWMTYSGCGKGCYEVGWAASADGSRWVQAPRPIIPALGGDAWNGFATQSAFAELSGDTWTFWYAGTGNDHGAVGEVWATW